LRSVDGTSFAAGMADAPSSAAALSALQASLISDSVSLCSCCTSVTRLMASTSEPARGTVALIISGSQRHLLMARLLMWPRTWPGCLRMLSMLAATACEGHRPMYHS
jgi:hypothetical protein